MSYSPPLSDWLARFRDFHAVVTALRYRADELFQGLPTISDADSASALFEAIRKLGAADPAGVVALADQIEHGLKADAQAVAGSYRHGLAQVLGRLGQAARAGHPPAGTVRPQEFGPTGLFKELIDFGPAANMYARLDLLPPAHPLRAALPLNEAVIKGGHPCVILGRSLPDGSPQAFYRIEDVAWVTRLHAAEEKAARQAEADRREQERKWREDEGRRSIPPAVKAELDAAKARIAELERRDGQAK